MQWLKPISALTGLIPPSMRMIESVCKVVI
jgi:hypothetical protein